MKKLLLGWKSLSRQEKMMAVLIVLLLAGVALRWDNVREKATLWFRADEIMEEKMRAPAPVAEPAGNDSSEATSAPESADVCLEGCSADRSNSQPSGVPAEQPAR